MTDLVSTTLKAWRRSAFAWGTHDCMLSVADYVSDVTGNDFGDAFRGTYSDEAGALLHIRKAGGEASLIDATGFDVIDVPARGDLVLVDLAGHITAGICTGSGVAFRMERGVCEISIKYLSIIKAWKVPKCHQ